MPNAPQLFQAHPLCVNPAMANGSSTFVFGLNLTVAALHMCTSATQRTQNSLTDKTTLDCYVN